MALRTQGVRVRRGPLVATYLDEGPAAPPRVGYALGRHLGGAVVRNRTRRRLRAVLAELVRAEPAAVPGGALVIGVQADVLDWSPSELRSGVVGLLAELDRRRTGSSR
ncbi:MAG: ribonuclease P protein component [Acidimicrobiales bacterium]